jgi:hypothetical protein
MRDKTRIILVQRRINHYIFSMKSENNKLFSHFLKKSKNSYDENMSLCVRSNIQEDDKWLKKNYRKAQSFHSSGSP